MGRLVHIWGIHVTQLRIVWTNTGDGPAHATIGGHLRTLCGQRSVAPRFGFPQGPRCPVCRAAVGEVLPPKKRR